ncbi:MAG TPA: DJ-1 family protein [Phycisphaerales bacterium]|nr:DJ-1 family protein [Phycisphaerales bacterium]
MSETNPKKAVLIIAAQTFRDEELFDTQAALESAGVETVIASTKIGTCTGKLGRNAESTMLVKDINVDDFDAIVFIGGGGAMQYYNDPDALKTATDACTKDKVIAAICIAPRILANAGLLKGISATCYESEAKALKKLGAKFQTADVIKDKKFITASGPQAAKEFGQTIAKALTQ